MSFGCLNVKIGPKYVYVTVGKTQKNGFKDVSQHSAGSIICFRSMTGNGNIFMFFELLCRDTNKIKIKLTFHCICIRNVNLSFSTKI